MRDIESVRAALLARPAAEETYPFDITTLVVKVAGKMFALLDLTSAPPQVSLKCDPDRAALLRAEHAAIAPGYHLNKRHWITLTLDGSLDDTLVNDLIDELYRLVVAGLSRAERARLAAG